MVQWIEMALARQTPSSGAEEEEMTEEDAAFFAEAAALGLQLQQAARSAKAWPPAGCCVPGFASADCWEHFAGVLDSRGCERLLLREGEGAFLLRVEPCGYSPDRANSEPAEFVLSYNVTTDHLCHVVLFGAPAASAPRRCAKTLSRKARDACECCECRECSSCECCVRMPLLLRKHTRGETCLFEKKTQDGFSSVPSDSESQTLERNAPTSSSSKKTL